MSKSNMNKVNQLANMQVENFLQPTHGVGVGISKCQGAAKSTQNFLHARMFARNLKLFE